MAQRIKTVQESDLRMLGSLARNIQRVLPVTQADIDAAAALGKGWVVTRVFEVSEPLDNLRGGTQLVIRQNSILPGQSVQRVLIVSGPGGQTVVIRGSDYIVLPDAIANSLSYVKAFGGTEQRNIPQPYTQVNYVTNTAQTAVNTGIMIDFAKNYEFEVECRAVSGSWYILQSRASASGNVTGIHGETSGSNIKLVVGNVTVCTSAITRTVGNKLYVKATLNAGTATLYVKDETANTEDTQTGSYGTSQPNPTASVYLLGNAGGQYVDINSDIYMARIKENDTVVMDYVPARQVATAGFYDTVSGTFKTAETPANLSADGETVPTPDAPMDIVSNNGVIKVSLNLLNPAKYESVTTTQSRWYYSDGYVLKAGTAYTFSCDGGVTVYIMRKSDSTALAQRIDFVTYTPTEDVVVWFRIYKVGGLPETINAQLELGSTATPYIPYGQIYTDGTVETIEDTIGNTATAEMLLKVSDYTDEQEILSGVVTRNVGVKVLDGTENWAYSSGWSDTTHKCFYVTLDGIKHQLATSNECLCSHFQWYSRDALYLDKTIIGGCISGYAPTNPESGKSLTIRVSSSIAESATDFTQWLADQYNAGTPVIIIYPLATPTTESVAGQTLQVTDGDNVLEITQASLTGLELEAEYQAAVSLTIQEVQDANLDPNVQVTIN